MNIAAQRWLLAVGFLGPILLLCAAIVFAVTEVHSSTDTYIGLAGGRDIMESTTGFPVKDTHSFTFEGHTWFNQNWLTHVWQWWMYVSFGPDAVIWGTWGMSALMIFASGLAVRFRCGSWLSAIVAAAIVGIGCRDWIAPRPATTQFFVVSLFWLLICAMESQGERRRWWPIVAMLPLLLIWGAAHGSFLLGYGLLTIYLVYWCLLTLCRVCGGEKWSWWIDALLAVLAIPAAWVVIWRLGVTDVVQSPRHPLHTGALTWTTIGAVGLSIALAVAFRFDRKRGPALSAVQVGALAGAALLAVVLTATLGPFGLDNFTHPFTVASTSKDADIWREIQEWTPAYFRPQRPGDRDAFPPVARFWHTLWWSTAIVGFGGAAWLIARFFGTGRKLPPAAKGAFRRITAYDILALAIGLVFTMFARRFGPFSLLFGAPLIATAIVLLWRPVLAGLERWGQAAVMLAAWVALPFMCYESWRVTEANILKPWRAHPDLGLLEIVTVYQATPHEAVMYLKNNDLRPKVLAEWTHAGIVFFYAPQARVYMDGRAQQVYTPAHYKTYGDIMRGDVELLDKSGADTIIMHAAQQRTLPLVQTVEKLPAQWVRVYFDSKGVVYMRIGSEPLRQLRARLEAGTEWRPDTAIALLSRGAVWEVTQPRAPERAVADWKTAIERDISFVAAGDLLWMLANKMQAVEGRPTVEAYLAGLKQRAEQADLPGRQRGAVLGAISSVQSQLDRVPNRRNNPN